MDLVVLSDELNVVLNVAPATHLHADLVFLNGELNVELNVVSARHSHAD